jgi:hypothetical protein
MARMPDSGVSRGIGGVRVGPERPQILVGPSVRAHRRKGVGIDADVEGLPQAGQLAARAWICG